MALRAESMFSSAFAPPLLTSLLQHEAPLSTSFFGQTRGSRSVASSAPPELLEIWARHDMKSLDRHLATISLSSGSRPLSLRSAAIFSDLTSRTRECDIRSLSRRLATISLSDSRPLSQRSAAISSGLFSNARERRSIPQRLAAERRSILRRLADADASQKVYNSFLKKQRAGVIWRAGAADSAIKAWEQHTSSEALKKTEEWEMERRRMRRL